MSTEELLQRLDTAQEFFNDTKYASFVREAVNAFESNDHVKCKNMLDCLPSKEVLIRSLLNKLRGKSVYKNLKNIAEGKVEDKNTALKGLFSLGAHIVVECQRGATYYRVLLVDIYEKIGQLLFE